MLLDDLGRPLVPVHECWNDSEADVVISCLSAHGIQAWANSEVPHSVLPLNIDGLGKVQVMVPEEDAEAADAILRERQGADSAEADEEPTT